MTPPTTPPPLPFAELLKLAQKTNRIGSLSAQRELQLRLLSWAHAGGVDELREAQSLLQEVLGFRRSFYQRQAERLRASIALLDGQREKP